jgi:hypothetical protein
MHKDFSEETWKARPLGKLGINGRIILTLTCSIKDTVCPVILSILNYISVMFFYIRRNRSASNFTKVYCVDLNEVGWEGVDRFRWLRVGSCAGWL